MKARLLSTVALPILVAGPAMAADLPVKAPAAPVAIAAPPSWTGFYIGLNAGGIWDSSRASDITPFLLGSNAIFAGDSNTLRPAGPIGGVQAGYNWQTSNWVFGIEADIDAASAHVSFNYVSPSSLYSMQNARLSALGTIRGRVGWDFGSTLAYVTGGAAFGDLKDSVATPAFSLAVSRNGWATGWTVGGGVEHAFAPHWSAKLEYLFAKFPDATISSPRGYSFKFRDSAQTLRAGVNYRY